MNPMTKALADVHINDLRRQACFARLAGQGRTGRRHRRSFAFFHHA